MKQSQVAFCGRQAIVDRQCNIVGYELLFRNSLKNQFPGLDNDIASAQLLYENSLIRDVKQLVGDKLAFVNLHSKLLENNVPDYLDPEVFVIEILETVEVNQQLIDAVKRLHECGIRMAIDDFDFDYPKWKPILKYMSFIKFEMQDLKNLHQIPKWLELCSKLNITTLAEKIEERNAFEFCLELGIESFQGYFYQQPVVVENKTVKPINSSIALLSVAATRPELDIDELENIFQRDVSLSVSLLRYINSASHYGRREITSIRHAMNFIGQQPLKKFLLLVCISEIADDVPQVLLQESILRGLFLEKLAKHVNVSPESALLVGIFSLLDVILGSSIEEVMELLPLQPEITSALINSDGALGELLEDAVQYIQSVDADEPLLLMTELNMKSLQQCYHEAAIESVL